MRSRKMRNAATTAIQPQAPRQTIHQHGTNWPLIILVSVLSIPLALFLVWAFLTFLFYEMEFEKPGYQSSLVVFGLLCLAVLGIVSREIIGYIISKWFDGRLELQQLINDHQRSQQLLAQTGVPASRPTSEETRLGKLIMLVMWHAYDHYSRFGEYGANDAKPWSRRSVAALTIAGESKPVGETIINGKVKRFLERENVIASDKINIDDYPNLDSVRDLLERRFNVPIKFYGNVNNVTLPHQEGGFSEFIEK